MLKGIVTYITNNRRMTTTKIRVGSRSWVIMKCISSDNDSLIPFLGCTMSFGGEWKESPSFGKYFLANDYNVVGKFNSKSALKRVVRFAEKNNVEFSMVQLSAMETMFGALLFMGKKAMLLKILKWDDEKKLEYYSNPYLYFINKHTDYYTAEVLALTKLFPIDDERKIQALIVKVLDDAYKNNLDSMTTIDIHCKVEEEAKRDIDFAEFLDILKRSRRIVMDGEYVFIDWIFYLRRYALKRLSVTEQYRDCEDIENEQLKELLSHKFSVLSGGAGTGKTTLLRKLSDIEGLSVVYCATTGKAAKVFSDEAVTVHHLLGYQQGKFTVKRLDCDVLVVDEASMLDWYTFHAIVSSVKRAIFSGDPKQLPPVHGEPVFKKIMEMVPVLTLSKSWRFETGHANVEDIYVKDGMTALTKIRNICMWLDNRDDNYQVLSPVKGGIMGIDSLNRMLQKTLNNKADVIGQRGDLRLGDRIVINRNVYVDGELIASNGEIGTVNGQQMGYVAVKSVTDNEKVVLVEEADIELAYAMTVHRAQGSEYDYVIFAIPEGLDKEFLTEELLHVGKTRGKTKNYVINLEDRPVIVNAI